MSRHGFKRYSLAVPVLLAFLAQGQQTLAEENKTAEVPSVETTTSSPVTPLAEPLAKEETVASPTASSDLPQNDKQSEQARAEVTEKVEATTTEPDVKEAAKSENSEAQSPIHLSPVEPVQTSQQATSEKAAPLAATQEITKGSSQTALSKSAPVKESDEASAQLLVKIRIDNQNDKAGTFDVRITEVPPAQSFRSILVPVWSDINGQDDIKWYDAKKQGDGSYLVNVSAANHKNNSGVYHAHLYIVQHDGTYKGFGGTKTELRPIKETTPSGEVTIKNQDDKLGTFDVIISKVVSPKGLRSISVPVWSERHGQDDIIWYTAEQQTDGTYKVNVRASAHKNNTGTYHAHVYLIQGDGSAQAIAAVKTNLSYTEQVRIDARPSIAIVNKNDSSGTFDVLVTNVAQTNLKRVAVPVWSDINGQDDIRWYDARPQANGSYIVNVNAANHKNNSGVYHAHLYVELTDGTYKGFGGTKTELRPIKETTPSGEVTIKNQDDKLGTFDVIISKVVSPKGLRSISVPVWSERHGQDDIIWYTAEQQTDGTYKVNVRASAHKNNTGTYHAHVYLIQGDGSAQAIAAVKTNLSYTEQVRIDARPSIAIVNKNDSSGTFDVLVTNVAQTNLKRVAVPVWSDINGQDDIRWYDARPQANGSYIVNVNAANHKNNSGVYHAHLYVELTDGSLKGQGGTSTTLNYQKTRSKVIFIDPGHGGRDPGAYYGDVAEKTLALNVSNLLKHKLEAGGYQVIMSRTDDQFVDFVTERSRLANNSNADIFVSIHFNASGAGTTRANGIETYWYESDANYPSRINQAMHNNPVRLAESESLARAVQNNLVSTTGATNRGVKRNTFAVLRETAKPSILVELGYMDNPQELAKIKQAAYQERLAEGLAKGIFSWYGTVGLPTTTAPAPNHSRVNATVGGTSQLKNLNSQQTQFLDAVYPGVKSAAQSSGLLPSVMTAQAILESGWGQSRLASAPNNNLYGIKAGDGWSGSTVSVPTKEFVNGRYIDTTAAFRTYPNWSASIANYSAFFTSTPWRARNYASYRAAKTYQTALPALQASGYATDPLYANKLRTIIERHNLQAWDK